MYPDNPVKLKCQEAICSSNPEIIAGIAKPVEAGVPSIEIEAISVVRKPSSSSAVPPPPDSVFELMDVEPEDTKTSSPRRLRSGRVLKGDESESSDEDQESFYEEAMNDDSETSVESEEFLTFESLVERAIKLLHDFRGALKRMSKVQDNEKEILTRWVDQERKNGRMDDDQWEKIQERMKECEKKMFKVYGTMNTSVQIMEDCLKSYGLEVEGDLFSE